MFKKTLIALTAAAATIAVPGVASAQYYPAPQPYYGGGYNGGAYGNGYYGRGGYGGGYYGNGGYYGGGYNNGYYGDYRGQRCSGTTGAIIGGVAGALLGREITRDDRNRWGHRRNNGTTGAIVGGAVGALIGNQVDKSSC